MDLGNKIKERRMLLNLTQEELADRCELTKSYISQLENNKPSPSLETLTKILEILGTDLSTFFMEDKKSPIVFNKDDHYVCEYNGYKITWLVPNSQIQAMEPIIIELEEKQKTRIAMAVLDSEKCKTCRLCIQRCPTFAIHQNEKMEVVIGKIWKK